MDQDEFIQEVLEYLTVFRSSRNVQEHFSISKVQSEHVLRWLQKVDMIETMRSVTSSEVGGYAGFTIYYRRK